MDDPLDEYWLQKVHSTTQSFENHNRMSLIVFKDKCRKNCFTQKYLVPQDHQNFETDSVVDLKFDLEYARSCAQNPLLNT